MEFFAKLPTFDIQVVFMMLYSSGLRIGEILSLKVKNVEFWDNSIDTTEIHEGQTNHSWISFFTDQTSKHLENYIKKTHGKLESYDDTEWRINSDSVVFDISMRTVQQAFQDTSEITGIEINPHLLRSVFTEKCTKTGMNTITI